MPPAGDPAASSTTPASDAPAALVGGPVVQTFFPPADRVLTAISYNPRFRESKTRAQDLLLEDMLGENLTVKMVARNSTPVAFVVPEGCDSVEFSYGAIEVNPDVGSADDLDQVVIVGQAQIQKDVGNIDGTGLGQLLPGSALLVTVPWRAASLVSLGANHLMVTIYARFYPRIRLYAPTIDSTS
jgi:hypothetical protein